MKSVVQRVTSARVLVDGEIVGQIGAGLVVFVGVEKGDREADALATATKIAGLRVFAGRTPMDEDLAQVGGACLVVSQFTLAGSVSKGRRPSFNAAEEPSVAENLYLRVAEGLRESGIEVETGRFGAMMQVELVNDGPVTLLVFARNGTVQ